MTQELEGRTIIHEIPTEEKSCVLCGSVMGAEHSMHFCVCDKCINVERDETVKPSIFEREKTMYCKCGNNSFYLYYDSVKCSSCGEQYFAPLGDIYKHWEGDKK